jgi:hypothetical protein
MYTAQEAYQLSNMNRKAHDEQRDKQLLTEHQNVISKILDKINEGINIAIINGEYCYSGTLDEIFNDYKQYENYDDIISYVLKEVTKRGFKCEYITNYHLSWFKNIPGFTINWYYGDISCHV